MAKLSRSKKTVAKPLPKPRPGKPVVRLERPVVLEHLKKQTPEDDKWYHAMVEHMESSVWVCDGDIVVTYANPKMCELLGYAQEEIVGRSEYDFWAPESADRVKEAVKDYRTKGIASGYQGELVSKSGEKIPVLVYGTPLPAGGTVGVITDFREMKKKEQELRESETRYRTIFETTGTATAIISEDMKIFLANTEFEKMSGYSKEELEGKKQWIEFFKGEDLKKMLEYHDLRRSKKGGAPRNYDASFIDRFGQTRSVQMTVAVIPGTKKSVGSISDVTEQKLAEAQLRASEEKYRAMIDQSMIGVFMLKGTKVVFANQKMADIFGLSSLDEIIGHDIKNFHPPEAYKKAKFITMARQAGEDLPEIGEYAATKKNGKRIYVQTFSKSITIGGETYAQVFMADVTEKKLMEIKLSERIKEFNVLYRVHSHSLMAYSLNQVLQNITQDIVYAFQFMKVARARVVFDEKVYQSAADFDDFVFKLEEPIVIRGEKRGVIEVGYTEKLPQMNKDPFWPEEKKLIKTIANILAKHIRSREAIERYRKLVKKSPNGIFITENNFLRYVNPRFCKMFGCKEGDAIGRSLRDFIPGCNCYEKFVPNDRLTNFRCETKGKMRNGVEFDVEIILQKIDYRGRVGIMGRILDVTKIKDAERELKHFNETLQETVKEKTLHLEEANRRLQSLNDLKDEFIAITSHELRSPLTSIRGYMSFLMEDENLRSFPDSAQQYLRRAYNNTEALNRLVNNILDVSRLDMGRFELQKTNTDIIQLVRSIHDGLNFQVNEKRLNLVLKNLTKKSRLMLSTDSIRVSQVIRNLLDNAIKFSTVGKSVYTTIESKEDTVIIKVIDEGAGIPKEKLEHVFDKFMQLKQDDTRYKGGAGLGLFISKRIIELHNGTLSVESKNKKGTTFIIQLPLTCHVS